MVSGLQTDANFEMTDLSRLLNPEQLEAATAPDGPLLILAAAGTGKTRTLIYRVAHLVERGVDPANILLLTFTNRAANEMLERARDVVGERIQAVWGGTFHHIANRILRRHATRLGYPNNFSILDSDEQRSLVGAIYKERKLTARDFMRRELLLSHISGARNRDLDLHEHLDNIYEDADVDIEQILEIAESYEDHKKNLQAMDFDDLLINVLKLLHENSDVLEQYQNMFEHVLVDEYQDTNSLQAEMVELLGARKRNISVVGDDFQCIYTWRGANFRNIMQFPERYPDARVIRLERNYRSQPGILHLANACISFNPDQFKKRLIPTIKSATVQPSLVRVSNGTEQAEVLVKLISEFRRRGYAFSDMAVLYRAHFHSIELQIQLARVNMPHRITSGTGVFEQAHVKDMLSFFRLAENPHDRLAFERFMGMIKGLGPVTLNKVWKKIGGSFYASQPEARQALSDALAPRLREAWSVFDELFKHYFNPAGQPDPTEVVDRFLKLFYRNYMTQQFERPQEREDDLIELATLISKSGNIRKFLAEVALLTNVDHVYESDLHSETTPDCLTLSTVHQAKGLEWPIVFIPWAVEGMFPSGRSIEDDRPGKDAEERRLFYVAITRAKHDLIILTPQVREMRDGGIYYCQPSRFVKEVPQELLNQVDIRPAW